MKETKHPAGHELQAYHDGELGTDARARLADHCERCARCRAELDELERMDGLLNGLDAPELPRSVWPHVAAAHRSANRGRLGTAFGFAATAACAAGLAIGILLGPVDFGTESATEVTAWSGPASLLSGGSGSTLFEFYQSSVE